MKEIAITTNKMNHLIDPTLAIWGWQVPVYLFLGGVTAGILIIAATLIILKKDKEFKMAGNKLLFFAPVILSIGMGALFLDLEKKIHVFRFYLAFKPTSPMSWGSWILLFVYALNLLLITSLIKSTYPKLHILIEEFLSSKKMLKKYFLENYYSMIGWSEHHRMNLAITILPFAISLGIYTGILLSAYVARPFWNVSILGPLFLVSGLSTAMALVMFVTKDEDEYKLFSKMDIGVMVVEIILLFLFGYSMFTSTLAQQNAIHLITGGELTTSFWVFFVGLGLFIPLMIEVAEIKGFHFYKRLAPSLVLFGGLFFRIIVVQAGQITTWVTNFK